jgi:hypothetical protein
LNVDRSGSAGTVITLRHVAVCLNQRLQRFLFIFPVQINTVLSHVLTDTAFDRRLAYRSRIGDITVSVKEPGCLF